MLIFCNSSRVLPSVFQVFACLKCPCAAPALLLLHSVAGRILQYSLNPCSFSTLCSHQMSVRQFRKRPSLNGSTQSCLESSVASLTSTWTCGMDACSLNCWRCCLGKSWYEALLSKTYIFMFFSFSILNIIPKSLVVMLLLKHSSTSLLPLFSLSAAKAH